MQQQMTDPPVALNPDLDLSGVRERFDKTGRLVIKDILHPATAGKLYACLSEETPWMFAYNEGNDAKYLSKQQLDAMSPQQKGAMTQQILANASEKFQYAYSDFPVSGTANIPNQPKFYTHKILKFMNDTVFRELITKVTGIEGDIEIDSHATCFHPGHFLTAHTDKQTDDDPRLVAYVINMTPVWRGDWGGSTVFYDDDQNVVETIVPIFNSLSMFKIPQSHSVSFVPPYCTKMRFGMTGWLFRPGSHSAPMRTSQ